ncbi:hypothetical protein EBR43_02170 [bacterium]|nr:hypothetical protein [bacterium]
MIFQGKINELTEDELSILFLICEKFLQPLGMSASLHFVKMLDINVVCKIVDVLKPQALLEKQEIFDNLKKKLSE